MARKQKEKNVKYFITCFFYSDKHLSDNFLILLVILYFRMEPLSNGNTKKNLFL